MYNLLVGKIHTCEAIVLKTYDIGDSDRYCILLTPEHGRIAVCAKGVRKITSKMGSAIQSFQHLRVDLAEHSSGMYLRSARCVSSFSEIRKDMEKFSIASRGCELLLHFLHDTHPSEDIFAISLDYMNLCNDNLRSALFPTFQLMLLRELGLLPSFHEDKSLSNDLRSYLCSSASLAERIAIELSEVEEQRLRVLCHNILKEHLQFPLKSDGANIQSSYQLT